MFTAKTTKIQGMKMKINYSPANSRTTMYVVEPTNRMTSRPYLRQRCMWEEFKLTCKARDGEEEERHVAIDRGVGA